MIKEWVEDIVVYIEEHKIKIVTFFTDYYTAIINHDYEKAQIYTVYICILVFKVSLFVFFISGLGVLWYKLVNYLVINVYPQYLLGTHPAFYIFDSKGYLNWRFFSIEKKIASAAIINDYWGEEMESGDIGCRVIYLRIQKYIYELSQMHEKITNETDRNIYMVQIEALNVLLGEFKFFFRSISYAEKNVLKKYSFFKKYSGYVRALHDYDSVERDYNDLLPLMHDEYQVLAKELNEAYLAGDKHVLEIVRLLEKNGSLDFKGEILNVSSDLSFDFYKKINNILREHFFFYKSNHFVNLVDSSNAIDGYDTYDIYLFLETLNKDTPAIIYKAWYFALKIQDLDKMLVEKDFNKNIVTHFYLGIDKIIKNEMQLHGNFLANHYIKDMEARIIINEQDDYFYFRFFKPAVFPILVFLVGIIKPVAKPVINVWKKWKNENAVVLYFKDFTFESIFNWLNNDLVVENIFSSLKNSFKAIKLFFIKKIKKKDDI